MIKTTFEYKLLETIADFKKKDDSKVKGYGQLAAAGYIGQQTVRSGIPRVLGVRLESHSTSNKNAKEILQNGGYLNPDMGGEGFSKTNENWQKQSQNYSHITGSHPDFEKGKRHKLTPLDRELGITTPHYEVWNFPEKHNPLKRMIHNANARAFYKGSANMKNYKHNPHNALLAMIRGHLGVHGAKDLYIGGSDQYFVDNFEPDWDDKHLKTKNKTKVYNNRLSATKSAIDREGLLNLIKSNPKRSLLGLGILGIGGATTYQLAKSGLNNIKGNKRKYKKKNNNYWSNLTNKR